MVSIIQRLQLHVLLFLAVLKVGRWQKKTGEIESPHLLVVKHQSAAD